MLKISTYHFIGQWVDTNGKILFVKYEEGEHKVDFYTGKNVVVERDMLGGNKEKSINMKAFIHNDELVVELGTEGLGPTLRLRYENKNDKEYLVPTVEIGLYDDWDDDFGVPWIFPLQSVYYKT